MDLIDFERQHDVVLPAAVVAHFSNGTTGRDEYREPTMIATWHLPGVKSAAELGWAFDGANSLFVFADYLIDSYFYAVRLTSSADNPAPVFAIYSNERVVPCAASFAEFVEAIRADDTAVLHRG